MTLIKRFITLIGICCLYPVVGRPGTFDIVPCPLSVERGVGVFRLKAGAVVSAPDSLLGAARLFSEMAAPILGGKLALESHAAAPALSLAGDSSLAREEYVLDVTRRGIELRGGSVSAVLYGLQSLRQLAFENRGTIPVVRIHDKPFFAYRGAMLDVCRHFSPIGEVKRFIDILALHKLNVFHWHLTDDQGWRIEIRRYPALTQTGSVRRGTVVGDHRTSSEYTDEPYGGYYTQDEIREVVAYAAERGIMVIPEIEMPGHAVAALAAYPWLGCTGGPYEVMRTWGVSEDVLCIGKESTLGFLKDVLTEVLELFPSEYIHIGGDESPRKRWKSCPFCQERIRREGLRNEAELQSYLVRRIEEWLRDRGRRLIGWDEILEGGVSQDATVMSWRGTRGGIEAARHGNRVVMVPCDYFYFDYYQTHDPARVERETVATGRPDDVPHVTVRRAYEFSPYEGLDGGQRQCILGVQGNIWREYMVDFRQVEHMLLPRLAALAEVAWSCDRRDFSDFSRRLFRLKELYDQEGYRYAPYFFNGTDTVPHDMNH